MPDIGTVRFLYPYTKRQPMMAIVVKTVTDPLSCFPPHIPEWLLPMHGLEILHGLIGNMMLQPGQSYSNPRWRSFIWPSSTTASPARMWRLRSRTLLARSRGHSRSSSE